MAIKLTGCNYNIPDPSDEGFSGARYGVGWENSWYSDEELEDEEEMDEQDEDD